MKRLWKTVTSLILSLVLVISMFTTASAGSLANGKTVQYEYDGEVYEAYITVNNGIATVSIYDTTVTYNKNTGLLEVQEDGKITSSQYMNTITPFASNGIDGYSYDYYNKLYNNKYYMFWEMSIPSYVKLTYETFANTSPLNSFKRSVDSVVSLDGTLVSNGFGGVITLVLAALGGLGGPAGVAAVIAILSALGFPSPIDAVSNFMNLRDAKKDAERYFNEVISISIPY